MKKNSTDKYPLLGGPQGRCIRFSGLKVVLGKFEPLINGCGCPRLGEAVETICNIRKEPTSQVRPKDENSK